MLEPKNVFLFLQACLTSFILDWWFSPISALFYTRTHLNICIRMCSCMRVREWRGVSVCVVHVRVCVCVCMCVFEREWDIKIECVPMCTHVRACARACVHARAYVCVHACVWLCVYAYGVRVCVCCVRVYRYAYPLSLSLSRSLVLAHAHTHIHSHTCIYIFTQSHIRMKESRHMCIQVGSSVGTAMWTRTAIAVLCRTCGMCVCMCLSLMYVTHTNESCRICMHELRHICMNLPCGISSGTTTQRASSLSLSLWYSWTKLPLACIWAFGFARVLCVLCVCVCVCVCACVCMRVYLR